MRRMYSEKELTTIINQVVGEYIEAGALDDAIAEYVDAYLVEHPVDITALNGQTITPAKVNATSEVTAPSIVETMAGYSFTPASNLTDNAIALQYVGCVKNGNKLTLVVAGTFSPVADVTYENNLAVGYFNIPSAIADKIIPMKGSAIGTTQVSFFSAWSDIIHKDIYIVKSSPQRVQFEIIKLRDGYTAGNEYAFRIESTFLLSNSLVA